MATRTITGTLSNYPRAVVRFKQRSVFAVTGASYTTGEFGALTDSAGAFSITIPVTSAGSIPYRVELPNGDAYELLIAAGATTALETLLSGSGTASTRTITGTLPYRPNAPVYFRQQATFLTTAAIALAGVHRADTDATGAFSIAVPVWSVRCVPYRITLPDGTNIDVCLSAGSATTLEVLLGAAAPVVGVGTALVLEDGITALLLEDNTTALLLE